MEIKREVNSKIDVALTRALKGLKGLEGRVGWFPSAKYEDGTFVASVAIQNEFGNAIKHIPPRSFMRTTIAEKQELWAEDAKRLSKRVLNGKLTPVQAMDALGQIAAGNIRNKITQIFTPPLAASTIKARLAKMANGKTIGNLYKPLVETKVMLNSLSNEVVKT